MNQDLIGLLGQLNTTSPKSSQAVVLLSAIVAILAETANIDVAPIQAVIDAQPAMAEALEEQRLQIAALSDQLGDMSMQDGALLEQISAVAQQVQLLTERVVALEPQA